MKITLDIDQLLSEGRISQDEYSRLKQFAAETTSSLALNIVLTFGIIAVAGGTIALLHSSAATTILGIALAVFGGFLCSAGLRWTLLGNVLLPIGALTSAGGIIAATDGSASGFLLVAALLIAGALAAQSGLLASLSVFALLSALGGSTGYQHAGYFLCIEQPLLTVSAFSILAVLSYFLSWSAPTAYSASPPSSRAQRLLSLTLASGLVRCGATVAPKHFIPISGLSLFGLSASSLLAFGALAPTIAGSSTPPRPSALSIFTRSGSSISARHPRA